MTNTLEGSKLLYFESHYVVDKKVHVKDQPRPTSTRKKPANTSNAFPRNLKENKKNSFSIRVQTLSNTFSISAMKAYSIKMNKIEKHLQRFFFNE